MGQLPREVWIEEDMGKQGVRATVNDVIELGARPGHLKLSAMVNVRATSASSGRQQSPLSRVSFLGHGMLSVMRLRFL